MDPSAKDQAQKEKDKRDAFVQKDYEMKITYLTDHYTRMWTRFNFFLVLESGLSAALWVWFKDQGSFVGQAAVLAALGLVTSLVWYVMGAEDRYLVAVYRTHVKDVGTGIAWDLGLQNYIDVSDPTKPVVKRKIYQWRCEPLSTTKLAAWIPLLFIMYWVVMLVSIK